MPHEQRILKFASHLSACSPEAIIYGKCVAEKLDKVKHNDCQQEFAKLITCFKKQVASKSTLEVIMKIKRMKRASRILTFFRYNYGFQAPHTVLLDGTFCQAALQNKINLREQMPKYLAEEVHMVVTNCVLQELEKLGSTVYGALAICRQFTVAKCPHKPARTASECIKHLARRSKTKDHAKYFIGSQDDNLLLNLRDLGGIPLMSIKFNTILLEKPSNESLNGVQKSKDELEKVKELKEEVLGSELLKKRKRKGPKGPNPLSCKKAKMDKKAQQLPGQVPGAFGKKKDEAQTAEEEENASSTKRKRTRKRRQKAHESQESVPVESAS